MKVASRFFLSAILVLSLLPVSSGSWAKAPAGKIRTTEAAMAEKIIQVPTREAVLDDQTGVRFPKWLGDMHINVVDDYSELSPDLGRAFHYGFADIKVSIYVYNLGWAEIESGTADPETRESLDGAVRDVYYQGELGYYLDITVTEPRSVALETATGKQDFLWVKFTYTEVDGDLSMDKNSWLFITGHKDHFFKVRYTCAADLFDEGMPGTSLLDRFLIDLGHLFD